MPDFDKLAGHVDRLQLLLITRKTNEGFPTWGIMVGQEWKAIAEMWRKPEPEKLEKCPDCGGKIIPYCSVCDRE